MREWLKKLRLKRNLSQQNVADELGITQQYYNLIENGERQSKMTIDTAQKLAKIFDVSLDFILQNENWLWGGKMSVTEKLNDILKEKNITIYKLSKLTGIKYELLRRVFARERKLSADEFVLILEKTGIYLSELN